MPKINFNRNIDIKPTKLTWKIFIGLIITMGLMIGLTMGLTMGLYIPGISKFTAIINTIIELFAVFFIYIPIAILSFLLPNPNFAAKYLVEPNSWNPSILGLVIAIIFDILFFYILSLIISKIISHLKNKHPSNHSDQ